MVDDLGLDGFFETSAKEGWQVTELSQAIRDGIDWDALPMISSSVLFDSIKQFLIEEKQQGRLLCTVDDLFRGFRRAHPDPAEDGALRASFETCIGRVESRGLIRRLHFGDLVLLQPELLDAYASGMVQAAKAEPDGLGFIAEEDALAGRFGLAETERVTDQAQEKLLLIATVEELLRHEIALKEITDRGVDLVFPSQFTRERPDAPDIPGKEVTFAFEGPLHNIYATPGRAAVPFHAVQAPGHVAERRLLRRDGRRHVRHPPARAGGGPGRAGAVLRRAGQPGGP